jgi:hypothetical protein
MQTCWLGQIELDKRILILDIEDGGAVVFGDLIVRELVVDHNELMQHDAVERQLSLLKNKLPRKRQQPSYFC